MNKTIPAIIVDDNKGAITLLQNMLQAHCPNVKILATFERSSEALKAVNLGKIKPELLFLDIQMDNDVFNGLELFEMIKKVDTNYSNAIFVTAHNNFTLQALRLNALDYLLKPVNKEELIAAVERLNHQSQMHIQQRVESASAYNTKQAATAESNIAIKNGYNFSLIKLFDICYCKADGNYSEIYTKEGKTNTDYPLKELTEMLPDTHFFRCHNAYLINGLHVTQFKNTVRDCEVTILRNNQTEKVPVSRSRKDELVEFLKQFSINNDIF